MAQMKITVPPVREELLRSVADGKALEDALKALQRHHATQHRESYAEPPSDGVRRARAAAANSVLPDDRHALAVELAVERYYLALDGLVTEPV